MSLVRKVSEFYDKIGRYLATVSEYIAVLLLIGVLSGGLFVAVSHPPVEGTTSGGAVAIIYPGPSYQFGAEAFIVGAILLIATVGIVALFRAPNVYGQKRYSTALAALGIITLLTSIMALVFLWSVK